jgi:hypothetical protein
MKSSREQMFHVKKTSNINEILVAVIPATWEAEIRRVMFKDNPGK